MHSTATEWNHIKMFDKLQKEIIGCLLFSNMIVCDRAWSKLQYSIDELKLCSISSLLFFVRTFVSVCVSYENEEEKIIWNWKISMCLKCKHETAQHMFTIGVNIFDRSKDLSNIRTLHMHMSNVQLGRLRIQKTIRVSVFQANAYWISIANDCITVCHHHRLMAIGKRKIECFGDSLGERVLACRIQNKQMQSTNWETSIDNTMTDILWNNQKSKVHSERKRQIELNKVCFDFSKKGHIYKRRRLNWASKNLLLVQFNFG